MFAGRIWSALSISLWIFALRRFSYLGSKVSCSWHWICSGQSSFWSRFCLYSWSCSHIARLDLTTNMKLDSPLSWIVALSSFLVHAAVFGVVYAFGIFYVALLEDFPGEESATGKLAILFSSTVLHVEVSLLIYSWVVRCNFGNVGKCLCFTKPNVQKWTPLLFQRYKQYTVCSYMYIRLIFLLNSISHFVISVFNGQKPRTRQLRNMYFALSLHRILFASYLICKQYPNLQDKLYSVRFYCTPKKKLFWSLHHTKYILPPKYILPLLLIFHLKLEESAILSTISNPRVGPTNWVQTCFILHILAYIIAWPVICVGR